jgi:hypothetical protein
MAARELKPNVALPELERQSVREDAEQRWMKAVKWVLLVLFAVLVFWLGESMVQHHFFSGGAMNYGNHPTGP